MPDSWSSVSAFPAAPRAGCLGVAVGTDIYVFGGEIFSSSQNEMRVYNTVADSWALVTSAPTDRARCAGGNIGGIIYAVGGYENDVGSPGTTTCVAYDPSTDTWANKTACPVANQRQASAVYNGKLYVFGGSDNPSAVRAYTPATDSWSGALAALPTPRYGCTAAVYNDRIYVIGGTRTSDTTVVGTVEEYNPNTDTWAAKTTMTTPRTDLATNAPVYGGLIYVMFGTDGTATESKKNEAYNPLTDSWASKTEEDTTRSFPTTVLVGSTIYVTGGIDAGSPIAANDAYEAVPASPVASVITLVPSSATKPVGQTHSVTATVTDQFEQVMEGVTVNFTVAGAHSTNGSDTTDSDGEATFEYAGSATGDDTITAQTS